MLLHQCFSTSCGVSRFSPFFLKSCLIIPCYNEAHRLNREAVEEFLQSTPTIDLMMVDDSSVDSTAKVLEALKSTSSSRLHVLCLASNQGKAEAVRAGVRAVLALNRFDVVGYCDADLATPLSEMVRLLRLGAEVYRSKTRHYLGRVFATVVSSMLDLPAYDTQCGAKVFRASIACELFGAEFSSR